MVDTPYTYEDRANFFRNHRNAEMIYSQGIRVIRGKIPAAVRRELMNAVKHKMLSRLPKTGMKPEVFFDPRHTNAARIKQAEEAVYEVQRRAKALSAVAGMNPDMEVEHG